MTRIVARPLMGRFNCTAFHVRDVAAFNADPQVIAFQGIAAVLEGQMDEDPAPCFAIARGIDPRPPFFIMRQPAEVVISERRDEDPNVDDCDGWFAMLQRHLAADEGIFITEWDNPAAPDGQLNWMLTCDAARCYLEQP